MGLFRTRRRTKEPDPDVVNMMLEAATTPSWHLRQKGWAVWSFEFNSPVYDFMIKLGGRWRETNNLAGRLNAIKPFLPTEVFQRTIRYATARFAMYLPPIQFRENLVVEAKDGEAFVLLPDPVSLSLIVPAPQNPAFIHHLFLNYPIAQDQPVRVLTVWRPESQAAIKAPLLAIPKGKPETTIRKLARVLYSIHPEDLGVIGSWDETLMATYLAYISELVSGIDQDSLCAAVSSTPKRRIR